MTRREAGVLLAAGLPGLLLAAVGTTHPGSLTAATGEHWRAVHVVALPLFPLLPLGPWLVARSVDRRLGWVVGLLGYVFATSYTALDVLAGIGAGALQTLTATDGIVVLFGEGDALARVGTLAYLAACVLAAAGILAGARRLTVPRGVLAALGTVLAVGAAWSLRTSHIFPPRGVLTMLAASVGWVLLALVRQHRTPVSSPHPVSSPGPVT